MTSTAIDQRYTAEQLTELALDSLVSQYGLASSLLIDRNTQGVIKAIADEGDEAMYQLWRVERARSILQATGAGLDKHGAEYSLLRDPPSKAIGFVTFVGTIGAAIPKGTQVMVPATTNSEEVVSETIVAKTVGILGTADVACRAMLAGTTGNVGSTDISAIKTPVSGITSVFNTYAFNYGRDTESDAAYRARILRHVAGLARGTVPSVYQGTLDFRVLSVSLYGEMDTTQDYIDVNEDLSRLPLASTGKLFLEELEVVSYAGIDVTRTPHRLTGIQRALEGTSAVAHSKGIPAREYIPLGESDRVSSCYVQETHGNVVVWIDDLSLTGPHERLRSLVQGRLRGEGTSRNPGYRGAGVAISVQAASRVTLPVACTIVPADGYTHAAISANIQDALDAYFASPGVGGDVFGYGALAAIQGAAGVGRITALSINSQVFDGATGADYVIAPNRVSRRGTLTITFA